eukprot:10633469-Karenia_brevis.AAC.3
MRVTVGAWHGWTVSRHRVGGAHAVFNGAPQSHRSHPPGEHQTPPRSHFGYLAPSTASAAGRGAVRIRQTLYVEARQWGSRAPRAI